MCIEFVALEDDLGKNCMNNIHVFFFKQKLNSCKKVYDAMAEEVKGKNLRPPESLKDYCQWLAEFNPNIQGKELEIPGTCMSEW